MAQLRCPRSHAPLRQALQSLQYGSVSSVYSSKHHFYVTSKREAKRPRDHIDKMLDGHSWSVESLLPDSESSPAKEITPQKLHHLLRLSALPLPESPEEEASMLKTLNSQLHFVRDIKKVNTSGVEPLQRIMDETEDAIARSTISLESLKEALDGEDFQGRNKRPRRRREEKVDTKGQEDWDVFSTTVEQVPGPGGNFFVVRSGKES